ncbi:hypothetical protein [Tunturiibacter empetritectus]|uniref:hypothetical protein n=1 Tax=Tunturiibacter empetritectus TaxID=3069691 RepID=UPI003D9B137A
MNRFGSVEEVRRRAGGAKSGGDLARDDAALADAGDDDAGLIRSGLKEMIDGLGERREHRGVEAEGELVESGCLDADELGGTR